MMHLKEFFIQKSSKLVIKNIKKTCIYNFFECPSEFEIKPDKPIKFICIVCYTCLNELFNESSNLTKHLRSHDK